MTIIDTINIEEAKKMIGTSKKPIIVKAQDVTFNRKILEYGRFDVLLSPEMSASKKSLRSLDSGMDYIMAKLASKNHVSIGIDINGLESLDKKEKALRLGKIIQNLKICKKAKTKVNAINFKDKRDTFSLLISLGASTFQAGEAVN